MLILLSPSKTLDFKNPSHIREGACPEFIKQSVKLIRILKKEPVNNLMKLMDISRNLAELNHERYQQWTYPYQPGKARPAFAAFKGDVYEGLKAWELEPSQVDFADQHVRILSGLYGLLKPTDLIMPYRLEMGIPLKGKGFDDLYQFWNSKISTMIRKELKTLDNNTVVNLASAEYAKAARLETFKTKIVTPFFLEYRNGAYKFITLNGKKARGTMTRYIIDHKITEPEQIKLFNYDRYSFDETRSSTERWVFIR